jgi:hypothetical protein
MEIAGAKIKKKSKQCKKTTKQNLKRYKLEVFHNTIYVSQQNYDVPIDVALPIITSTI